MKETQVVTVVQTIGVIILSMGYMIEKIKDQGTTMDGTVDGILMKTKTLSTMVQIKGIKDLIETLIEISGEMMKIRDRETGETLVLLQKVVGDAKMCLT